MPGIDEDQAAQRGPVVAQPGRPLDPHQEQRLVHHAEQRMVEQLPQEADDDRRQHHRQEDDHLVDPMSRQRLQQREGDQVGQPILGGE